MAGVQDVLERLSDLQPGERLTADQLEGRLKGNDQLVDDILQHMTNHVESHSALIVYEWLYNCYKTQNNVVRLFVLQCMPPVISNYLSATSSMNTQLQSHTEPCLLEIHNQEAIECELVPGKQSFSMPSLARASIYHHPKSTQSKTSSSQQLTESALHKHNLKSQNTSLPSPPRITRVNASNRMVVIGVVLSRIRANFIDMSLAARTAFCHMCVRLAVSGFPQWTASLSMDSLFVKCSSHLSPLLSQHEVQKVAAWHRLHLTPHVLQEMISSVYVCLYHEENRAARQAVEAIRLRAQFDGTAQVLMVVNAILNGLKCIDGNPGAGPLGFSLMATQVMSRKVSVLKHRHNVTEEADENGSFHIEQEEHRATAEDSLVPQIQVLAEEFKPNHQDVVSKESVAAENIEMSAVVSSDRAAAAVVSAGDINVEVVEDEKTSTEDVAKSEKPLLIGNEFETFV